MTSVVWFRQDLRLRDNPALAAAAARGPVLPVFILDDVTPGPWRWGAASRWWLHHSLAALRRDIGQLTLLRGDARDVLPAWIRRTGATAVHWNRCYEPFAIARDTALKAALQADGIEVHSHNGSLLREPWEVATADGGPFRVYTPFWRACMVGRVADPLPVPPLAIDRSAPAGDALEDWSLQPVKPNWAAGWERLWQPGEAGALARLEDFVADNLAEYEGLRDWPGLDMTSRLSPHLHWGEISPRQVWARVGMASRVLGCEDSVDKFLRRDRLARIRPPSALSFSATAGAQLAQRLRCLSVAQRPRRPRRLAARPHRLSAGRCRHAGAVADRVDAQPRAHGGGELSGQAPADRLADR